MVLTIRSPGVPSAGGRRPVLDLIVKLLIVKLHCDPTDLKISHVKTIDIFLYTR
jgi:hypothetical protein